MSADNFTRIQDVTTKAAKLKVLRQRKARRKAQKRARAQ